MEQVKLQLDGLVKAFGGLDVLDDVGFDVAPGEFVAVMGPSGCGKSTLFNLIAGLERPDAGRVLVDGVDVTGEVGPFAYMPQEDLLFPWRTVLANAALGLEVAGVPRRTAMQQARELFAPFGLAGFEDARPRQLSGGMRQRVALLRTVVQQRPVLLLDEPFGALDALTRAEMQGWLAGMRERFGWTVLMVTHDVREAAFLADRVVVLSARPARVVREIDVGVPHPRGLAALAPVEEALLAALRGGG
ncbi:MAG: ABC transporter ATP-binding protein [Pseudonocardia sp.]